MSLSLNKYLTAIRVYGRGIEKEIDLDKRDEILLLKITRLV
jgi:hypothetical protein